MNSPPILAAAPVATAAPPARGIALLRLGFRPFYLGAAVFAALSVPLWVAIVLGKISVPMSMPAMLWHAHEMLFGFAAAVIVGFLLTAGKAWTGLATPRGSALGVLALLWLCARVTALVGPYALHAALDMLLLPVVAGLLTAVLLRAGNRRNLPLPLILLLLAAVNAAFHLAALGMVGIAPMAALHAGLGLIVMIECVMAGRVIPAFTVSATPGLKLRSEPRLDRLTLAMTAIGLASWVFAPPGPLPAAALGLAAVLHVRRLWNWRPLVTRKRPILWILHAAYAWIPVGLVLLALAELGLVGASPGVHALAVGATGGLVIGMVTRTARGHTGRPLQASKAEVVAYALVLAAALLRALVPLLAAVPGRAAVPYDIALIAAAAAWSSAFGIYLWVFTPWLMTSRLDGKDG
ncbi:MAG: NnrS family protein [Burkholderiales bacterium]|nr:NnrS family protein [Burkholderiales bacterium]